MNIFLRTHTLRELPKNLLPRFHYEATETSKTLTQMIKTKLDRTLNIPCVINGKEYYHDNNGKNIKHVSPLDKSKEIYKAYQVKQSTIHKKLNEPNFDRARRFWNDMTLEKRMYYFDNVACDIENNKNNIKDELLSDTIVGQGKSLHEAEIDAICETVDFLNFNNYHASQILNRKLISTASEYNFSEINGLNGFVVAITPFNFTAIAANLVSAPLLMGTPVIWKPSDYSLLSNYTYYKLLLENNIPPELISFIPMNPEKFMDVVTESQNLAGILFTGSSKVFDTIYKRIGNNIHKYNNYPRLIGETGGKNFHFVFPNANVDIVARKTFESAFGYNGQKCSACSRLYLPKSMMDTFMEKLWYHLEEADIINYQSRGLINKQSYDRIIDLFYDLKHDPEVKILRGAKQHSDINYSIDPTILMSNNPDHYIFKEEFFAPILAINPYHDSTLNQTLYNCMNSNKYALTGSIFIDINDKKTLERTFNNMRFNAGNFYINDKSTGAVVGRQPFGGLGKSGTNDKAGDINFLYRLINQRSVKVNLFAN
jgi:1-pyrroline-5-carboxylate dehydrogenase